MENNYLKIYLELKVLPKERIKETIDNYYKTHGLQFLESLITNAIFDIESAPTNPKPNQIITYIEKYSERLIEKEERKKNLPNILNKLNIWLIAIGTIGLLILEIVKFILDYFCWCGQ
ncbi:MAG: hypothetical protein AB7P01_11810 [Bacteroidia bacterium]